MKFLIILLSIFISTTIKAVTDERDEAIVRQICTKKMELWQRHSMPGYDGLVETYKQCKRNPVAVLAVDALDSQLEKIKQAQDVTALQVWYCMSKSSIEAEEHQLEDRRRNTDVTDQEFYTAQEALKTKKNKIYETQSGLGKSFDKTRAEEEKAIFTDLAASIQAPEDELKSIWKTYENSVLAFYHDKENTAKALSTKEGQKLTKDDERKISDKAAEETNEHFKVQFRSWPFWVNCPLYKRAAPGQIEELRKTLMEFASHMIDAHNTHDEKEKHNATALAVGCVIVLNNGLHGKGFYSGQQYNLPRLVKGSDIGVKECVSLLDHITCQHPEHEKHLLEDHAPVDVSRLLLWETLFSKK